MGEVFEAKDGLVWACLDLAVMGNRWAAIDRGDSQFPHAEAVLRHRVGIAIPFVC
jgi:hypothetical protein